jgi:hypothetical protein
MVLIRSNKNYLYYRYIMINNKRNNNPFNINKLISANLNILLCNQNLSSMKFKANILLLAALAIGFIANAQRDTIYLKKESKKKIFTDRPPQAFYAELAGAGLGFSANYDRRFNQKVDGLGFRVGLGYSFQNDFKFTSLPLGVNYLIGNSDKGRYFEAGLNGTLMFVGSSNNNYTSYNYFGNSRIPYNSTQFVTTINLGYRSQPIRGGFNFRAGLTPMLLNGETEISAYLSFGYNF